jgi:nitric oxide dioxygenase
VADKVRESDEIVSFHLEPVDGGAVVAHQPGQYLGLKLVVDGQEVRRNYSLSQAANGRTLRISVKREPGGVVSNHLHDHVATGDVLDVFPPAGEFVLREGSVPLVLISGGVGITPTLAMAEAALAQGTRDVIFIHYARNGAVQAFGPTLAAWAQAHPRFTAHVVLEAEAGRPGLEALRGWVPADADAYFLGPKPFMAVVDQALAALGFRQSGAILNALARSRRSAESGLLQKALKNKGECRGQGPLHPIIFGQGGVSGQVGFGDNRFRRFLRAGRIRGRKWARGSTRPGRWPPPR